MGRIKSTLVKRTAKKLIVGNDLFTESFEENKRLLGNTMPSKRIRNMIAGYITRLKKIERKNAVKVST